MFQKPTTFFASDMTIALYESHESLSNSIDRVPGPCKEGHWFES